MRLVTGPAASLSLILCPQCSTSHRSISDTLLHILFLARISPILDSLFSAAVSPAALQPTTCPDLHGFCHTFPRSGLLCQVSICQSFTPEVCIYLLPTDRPPYTSICHSQLALAQIIAAFRSQCV